MTTESATVRPMRARFKGACYACRRAVAPGDEVGYDRASRRLSCYPACPEAAPSPASAGPSSPSPPATEPAAASVPAGATTLSALLKGLRGAIEHQFPAQYWVRAEILRLSAKSSGFVFLELADSTDERRISAQIHARISPRDRSRILGRFAATTGAELAEGMAILAAVSVAFDRFGLMLTVHDVDPSYTAGAQTLAAREIRERLEAEDVITRNATLPSPRDFTTVAVIAPDGAQGLDDFRSDADRLDAAGLCSFVYRPARFAGPDVAEGLVRALEGVAIQSELVPYDAVVLLRGGGPAADLVGLNDYELARAVCTMPMPVFTAIGHESDETLLDLVAHRAFGTPSKVITHIRSTIVDNAENGRRSWIDIHRIARHTLTREREALDATFAYIRALAAAERARDGEARAVCARRDAESARAIPYPVAIAVAGGALGALGLASLGHPLPAALLVIAAAITAFALARRRL